MPLSLAVYTSDGKQRDFAVPFLYIKKEYVRVIGTKVDDRGRRVLPASSLSFTWINDGLIRLDRAYPAGGRLVVQRWTHADTSLVDYQDAAIVTEADLDLGDRQGLHVAQEARDNLAYELEALRKDVIATAEEIFDQEGRVIKHASSHAKGGTDPVTPASIGAPSLPPATGKAYLGTANGWLEFVDGMSGGTGAVVVMQVHYFDSDGVTTEFTIRHTLNSLNVAAFPFDASTGERVYFEETAVDEATVRLSTVDPLPAGGTYRVILLAPGVERKEKGRKEYVHVQKEPAVAWVIPHGLGNRIPLLRLFDDEGDEMVAAPDWSDATEDSITVRFFTPISGKAIVTL